ncbi:MAG: hypothetical protein MJY66_08385 [Bacteroidaceae bacterium]|nr:hypothetical protein [Bacteroidaceae bacterium]
MWTDKEKELLQRGISEMMPFGELCARLGRSEQAVRQYMFKIRMQRKPCLVKVNLAKSILLMCIPDPECFRPNRAFYKAVNMSQKRWWSVFFGESQITPIEYRALCRYFNVPLQDAFDAHQLDLQFKNNNGSAANTED